MPHGKNKDWNKIKKELIVRSQSNRVRFKREAYLKQKQKFDLQKDDFIEFKHYLNKKSRSFFTEKMIT